MSEWVWEGCATNMGPEEVCGWGMRELPFSGQAGIDHDHDPLPPQLCTHTHSLIHSHKLTSSRRSSEEEEEEEGGREVGLILLLPV